MRKNLISITFVILFLTLVLMGCGPALHSKSGTTTTVILIRHAEKTEAGTLSPQGHARAQALVDTVGEMGVEVIYSPNLLPGHP